MTDASQQAHEDFFTRLERDEGYDFQYSPRGSKATGRRAGWWWQPEVPDGAKGIIELPTIDGGPLTIEAHKVNLNVESLVNVEVLKSSYPDGEADFLIVLRGDESQGSVVLHRASAITIKRLAREILRAWASGGTESERMDALSYLLQPGSKSSDEAST